MSSTNKPSNTGTSVQPSLSSLMARYIQRQADAQSEGTAAADPVGDVVPYEVGPVQPIDAKPAWEAALAVAAFYGHTDAKTLQAPPQWPHLVSSHEPEIALPFCLGNFPQLVRSFQTLTQAKNLSELRPGAGRAVHAPALVDWAMKVSAAKKFPVPLLALGVLRLAKQFEEADKLVQAVEASVPSEWKAAWDNEKAALAWQRGKYDEALTTWQAMKPTAPVLFNRGMAALFSGKSDEARKSLKEAVKLLPETSPWHHLGQLYLTMIG